MLLGAGSGLSRTSPKIAQSRSDALARRPARKWRLPSHSYPTSRARRICEKGAESLGLDRLDRTLFLKATEKVVGVRDVNEHGFEPNARSKPSMHFQEGGYGDETSLAVHGPDQILMGPLNLRTIYDDLDRLRKLAGFAALEKARHR